MLSTLIGASALFFFGSVYAKHGSHEALEALHRRHREAREASKNNETLVERSGCCAFPTNAGLVPVTPSMGNGGWAFATDQTCYAGRYCPYACPPGQVSMQWDPSVTSYTYPGSMNGGLLCNSDGTVSKPYPSRPYCQSTASNIGVVNTCGENVAFCQTVLPGDEDMLIPTNIETTASLAIPDPTYWAGTAAHYYINPPGISGTQGCVWGSNANPFGNWAPYVAGGNSDSSGQTFIKLGWNPIYLEQTTPFRNDMPTWGVKIECPNGGCNGLPCSIDPSKNGVNQMTGSSSDGAGGAAFCVVTVPKGSTANFVIFQASGTGNAGQWSNERDPSKFSSNTTQATTSTRSATSNSTSYTIKSSASTTSSMPSQIPYDMLFNSSTPAESSTSVSESRTTTAVVAKHTGGASSIEVSIMAILIGLGTTLW